MTPLSICWFLNRRSSKYLGNICRFSRTLTVSSGKYHFWGPAYRAQNFRNRKYKAYQGSLVVMTSRDKPVSTLCSKTHVVFLLRTQYHVQISDLMCRYWRMLLYPCRDCLLDYTSDVHLEGYFSFLGGHFFIDGVMYHMTIADNMSIPKSSLLWSGPLAGCYVGWDFISVDQSFVSLQIGD